MSEIERLLEPIAGDNPVGKNLKYSLYDKIKEARREELAGPMGQWEREPKTADYKQVIRLAEDALLKTTKDLWVAAWLTEAWIYEYEVPGLTSGLQLMGGLVERFWDHLYPELEDGDAELRASPLEWVGSYFDPSKGSSPILALRKVGLTQSGHDWFTYQESRRIGFESEVKGNEQRKKARDAAIKDKKVTPEEFDKDFEGTPKQFYKDLERDSKVVLEVLDGVNQSCQERFADAAPSFSPLRKAIEEFANVVHILLLRKLEKEPDLPEPAAPAKEEKAESKETAASPAAAPVAVVPPLSDTSQLLGGPIASMDQATLHVIAASQFIRQTQPASPVPYMLLRALRWGEMRNAGATALTDLPAPPAEVRRALKTAAADKKWTAVLETAETAMSSHVGRGWLDLQRYAIKACDELGYKDAAKAIRSELKTFLIDFPQLPSATLNDDTGAANPETLVWLKGEGLTP
jgi:type VI secretion system protein ImpA